MTSTAPPGVSEAFLDACQQHRQRTAVVSQGGDRFTYGSLADRVRARADAIDSLMAPEVRRVGLYGENSVEYLVSYYATVHSGRVPFLVDPQFGGQELAEIRSGCGVRTFLVHREVASRFPLPVRARRVSGTDLSVFSLQRDEGVAPLPISESTATCRFTSGTTGKPKCLEFSHHSVLRAARSWAAGTGVDGGDRTLCLAGFSNGLAFNTSLLPTFLVGAQLHLARGLPSSSKIRQAIRRRGITRLIAFPLVYRLISDDPAACVDDYKSLSIGISAGAVLAPVVRRACTRRLGVWIADYYGIAEAGPCTFETESDWNEGLGKPLPGVSIRLNPRVDGQAEVCVKTDSMATRYLNLPGLFEESLDGDGYYRTGDIGYLQGGRLFLTGRSGGAINVGGRKIDPLEVEQVALSIPGVEDAVVFADQDSNDMAALHLVVAGPERISRLEIVRSCAGQLSEYKIPAHVTWLPRMPRSAAGKVSVARLRELIASTKSLQH